MSCKVSFVPGRLGWTAVKRVRGRAVNSINYPRGARLTAKEKRRAHRLLCGR